VRQITLGPKPLRSCSNCQRRHQAIKPARFLSNPNFLSTSCHRYGLLPCVSMLDSSDRSVLARRNLADTQNRGSLDATDFCIAMYLIQSTMSGQLSFVPTSLPPGLYDQVSGKFDAVVSHATGSSSQLSPSTNRFPASALQPQLTSRGPPPSIPPRPAAVPGVSTFNHATPFGIPPAPQWDIAPAEKANSDRFFDGLDTAKKDYIEAGAAVPFMMQSNLPEDVLAQIWCARFCDDV